MTTRLGPTQASDFLKQHPDLTAIELLVPDMNGMLRGKRLQIEALAKLTGDGVRMPASHCILDSLGQNCEIFDYGSTDGDPDVASFGVAETLAIVPWAETPTAQILGELYNDDGTQFFADPRAVLKRAMQPLTDLGLTAVCAVELEFYLLDPKLGRDGRPKPARVPGLGTRPTNVQVLSMAELDDFSAVLSDIETQAKAQGLPVDVTTSEYAPGQFEINLIHSADAVAACDQAVLYKRAVKAVAKRHGMIATFMAKPFAEFAGSGLHIHTSLIDAEGRNVFAGAFDEESGLNMDPTLKYAIGGLRETMPEAMAILAPNANSYRRFRSDSYAPINRAWGVNNRTVSMRIPHSDEKSIRVEHRASGADANPYLATAAILAGIHHGISNKLDPGPIEKGDAYQRAQGQLPLRWEPALNTFEEGQILRNYWGEQYHLAFAGAKRWEADLHHNIIPPHDFEWYMRSA